MKRRVIFAAAMAAAALLPLADTASAASSRPFLPSPQGTSQPPPSSTAAQRRPGSHYSIVAGELIRQCADLEGQFDRAVAGVQGASWTRNAQALRAQGGTACSQGERDQGIDQLRAAVKAIGAVPHTTY
jgi:hypothetical protein